jgi:hypothetical protein
VQSSKRFLEVVIIHCLVSLSHGMASSNKRHGVLREESPDRSVEVSDSLSSQFDRQFLSETRKSERPFAIPIHRRTRAISTPRSLLLLFSSTNLNPSSVPDFDNAIRHVFEPVEMNACVSVVDSRSVVVSNSNCGSRSCGFRQGTWARVTPKEWI